MNLSQQTVFVLMLISSLNEQLITKQARSLSVLKWLAPVWVGSSTNGMWARAKFQQLKQSFVLKIFFEGGRGRFTLQMLAFVVYSGAESSANPISQHEAGSCKGTAQENE